MFRPSLDQRLVLDAIVGDSRRALKHLESGASPLYMDPMHGSALIQAVRRHHAAMVAVLIDHGADANAVFAKTGLCALDHALEIPGDRLLTDLCAGTSSAAPAHHEPGIWPESFFDLFAVECVFGCCDWKACDFGDRSLDQAMEFTGLNLDEFAFLTHEVLSASPAELAPLGSVGKEVGKHMHQLLATIHRHQENPQ